jgi:DNA-binding transcriptional LysR family regulator
VTAKHLSITKAAQEFRISQSTVSRKLKQLEQDLGAKLLKRHGTGIELTHSGREYLEKIVPIMAQVEDAKRSIADKGAESLAIGACRGPAAVLLPSLMMKFRESHSSVRLTLYAGNSAEALEWLSASMIDIAVITSPPKSASFRVEPYRRERLTAFVAATHPLAKKSATAAELTNLLLIVRVSRPEQTRTENEINALRKAGQKIIVAMRCGSSRAVKEAVRHVAGVGILYHDAVKREIDQGEFNAVTIPGLDLERQSYIVFLKKKTHSVLTREFLSLLRASAPQDSPTKTIAPQSSNKPHSRQVRNYMRRSKLLY